jgi:class 3 adenylate cyclase/tetratricopeptide (TPR) repeat protein
MANLRRHIPDAAIAWDDESPGRRWRTEDATLVFADISGFTVLTERLTSRGRIGAEEIVETLNRVFSPMLDTAARRGGQLLKFGGDALFFMFSGEGHTDQACDAVIEMRGALRAAQSVPTSVGRLRLSMSVGVHAGEVLLFLVGEPTRELLVLGPATTATARAESAAVAGQTLLSDGAAQRLPADAVRPGPGGLHILRRRVPRSIAGVPGVSHRASGDQLRTLLPACLGHFLEARVPDPEHRVACISFARFSGTDAILTEQGPDTLAAMLQETVAVVEAELATEGVCLLATDIDADGGKFFMASGVPESGPDDPGAMLRAMRAVVARGTPLPLQIGVNRGHVFVAEIGTAARAAYSAMGDTTNTAARIMGKAQRGMVLSHPGVLEHARTRFEATPVGPLTLKGKKAPLTAYAVGEEIGSRQAGPDTRLPFVGRAREVAAIESLLAQADEGRGGALIVSGGPGAGKSRLVGHTLRRRDVRVLALRAEPYGTSSAYRVLRDPMRDLVGVTRADPQSMGADLLGWIQRELPHLAPMAPLLADVVQVAVPDSPQAAAIDPQYRRDRTAELVSEVLRHALPGPLAIVVEEAQWADDASAQLLSAITARASEAPWAVIAIRRDEDGGFLPEAEEVRVEPLTPHESRQLVAAATEATPLRPHEIDAIVERADGNPMFIEEATRIVAEGGSSADLPDSVQSVMGAQIDMLAPMERAVLRRAAVLGRSFRREVLRATLARDGLRPGRATIDRLGSFLAEDGTDRLVFRNSLIRDAAYEGLAYRARTRLHAAAGLAVESLSSDPDADASTLSLHFWRAGDDAKTWTYARRAAEIAVRAYANIEAATHYERALEAGRHLPGVDDEARAGIWAELGRLRDLAGMLPQSVEAYRRAESLTSDPVARADVRARRARVHDRAGEYVTGLRVVARARRILADAQGPRADAVDGRLDLLTAFIRLGQEKPALARVLAARAVAKSQAADDPETTVQALTAIDFADAALGVADVGEATRRALEICVAHGFRPREAVARANLGAMAFYAGRWDEALDWYTTSRRVAVEAGSAYGAAEGDLSLAEILINQGRLDEAEQALVPAIRTVRVSGIKDAVAYGRMQLARVRLGQGRLDEADELAGSAVATFVELGQVSSAFEARIVQAQTALERDDAEDALELLDGVEDEVGNLRARAQWVRAGTFARLRRPEEALTAVADGLRAAQEQDVPYETALLLHMRSRLSPPGSPDATRDASAAARIFEELGVLR